MEYWEYIWRNIKLPASCQTFAFTFVDTDDFTEDAEVRRYVDTDGNVTWQTKKDNQNDISWFVLPEEVYKYLNIEYELWNKSIRDVKLERILDAKD